jgi:hypothetical protein
MFADFCKRREQKFLVNYTGRLNTVSQTYRSIKEVTDLKLILRRLSRNEGELIHTRNKRGGISKILFGNFYIEDANYYTNKITPLENEQLDFLILSKEQITVVKTTPMSVNSTFLMVSENEKFLSKGLEEKANHINEQDGEIWGMFTAYSLLLTNSP